MRDKKRLVLNLVTQIGTFIIGLAINFVLTPYITNHIGKEIYGFVGLANTFTSYIVVLTVAFNGMLNRFVTVKLQQKDIRSASVYYSSVTVANIMGSILMIIPATIMVIYLQTIIQVPADRMSDIKMLWAFIFTAFIIGIATSTFNTAAFAKNRLDLAGLRNLEGNIIKVIVLVVAFTFFPANVWYVGLATLISGAFISGTNYIYRRKLIPEVAFGISYFDLKTIFEMVKVGIWNSVNKLTQVLVDGLDLLVTNLFFDPLSMSLMAFSKTVPINVQNLINLVSNTFTPQMTMAYAEGDIKKFIRETNYALKVTGLLCSVPILGFIVFGEDFFALWLRTLTNEEIITVQILSILTLLPTFFSVYLYPLYSVNMITCKLSIPVLVSLAIGILNVVGIYIILSYYNIGIVGIKIVSSVLLLIRVLVFTPMYAAHVLEAKWYVFYKALGRGAVASILVLIELIVINTVTTVNSWSKLILCAAIGGGLGYMINYLVILEKEERSKINRVLINRFRRK